MPSQDILKIRDGTPLENKRKKRKKRKKRVAHILVFKIRPSQDILKIRDGTPLENKRVARILVFKIRPSQEILKIRDGTTLEKKRVARILVFKIRPYQEILKIRDGTTHLEKKRVARILFFKIWPSQEILKIRDDVPSNVLQKKRVARILFFKIWPSQKILKIRDGTPLEAEEILTYRKSPQNGSVWYFSSKLDIPSNVLQKKRVAHILVFKIRPSQDILKIRDGTPLEAEEILTYRKKPSKWIVKRVVRILVFKIRSSQEIHKIRDGTPLEVEEILTYIKKPRNGSFGTFLASYMSLVMYYRRKEWHGFWFSKLDHLKKFSKFKKRVMPSQDILKIRDGTPLENKRVARILVFKIRPSQEILKIRDVKRKKRVAHILVFKIRPSQDILKIRDGTPLENKRVARILVFKIRPSQEILKIRDGTTLEKRVARILVFKIRPYQEILKIRDDVPSNVLQKKRVARILFFKIWPSQKILKIRDGTPLEAEEILTYRKSPQNGSVWYFSSKLDIPSNVLQKKRVAHILVFKIRPSQDILKIRDGTPLENKRMSSQEIHKIRDGTPLEVEEILTYIKKPRNGSFGTFLASYMSLVMYYRRKEWHGFWFSKLDHLKKFSKFKKRKKRVARILFFKIWPSQEILKIRDGTPLEAEEILTYRKSPQNGSVWYFSSKLDIPSNVLQKKRVAHILVFKIRPSQDILKIRDDPFGGGRNFDIQKKILKMDRVKKRVARILVFKIRPSQEILKIRDGTPLEVEEILTYIKKTSKWIVWHFSSKLDVPSNVLQKKRVARILFFKIRPSQEILKIRDGTTLEAGEILTYRKKPSKWIEPSQDILKIRDEILKIRDEILKIRDVKKRVARILFFKIWPSQKILKIRDGTPLEAEEILTYRKSPQNGSVWYFSSKLDIPSNVLQKKRVAHILVFKIRPSQDILKIRDGTPLEAEEILTYRKKPSKWIESTQEIHKIRDGTPLEWHGFWFSKLDHLKKFSKFKKRVARILKKRVARILFFKIWPSQKILKIRDGTPLEAEEILTYRKSPQNGSVWYFSSKLDIPSNVLQKKRVAHILVFKIRPSQDILKIRDGTPLEWSSQEIHKIRDGTPLEWHGFWFSKLDHLKKFSKFKILKIRDGTPLEAEEILTYRKRPQNGSVWYFSSNLDIPSNVLQKKRVAHILVFKIRPSQDILKIRDDPFGVARILFFKIRPSQEILKIRDGTPLEVEEILTYIKKTSKWIVWHFSSKLDVPSNVLQKKRVARILFFKIRPSQEILKIRDGTTLEKRKKRVARILVFKIRPSQEILKIRDGTPLEKKRVVRILVFKIRSTQEIHKIRDGTPLEVEEILTYIKKPRNGSKEWHGF
ncbi:hypothetical protein OROHE_007047 [Orobanche hederae]